MNDPQVGPQGNPSLAGRESEKKGVDPWEEINLEMVGGVGAECAANERPEEGGCLKESVRTALRKKGWRFAKNQGRGPLTLDASRGNQRRRDEHAKEELLELQGVG